jgi:hypothetical protein
LKWLTPIVQEIAGTTGPTQPNDVLLRQRQMSAVGMIYLAYVDVGVVKLVFLIDS